MKSIKYTVATLLLATGAIGAGLLYHSSRQSAGMVTIAEHGDSPLAQFLESDEIVAGVQALVLDRSGEPPSRLSGIGINLEDLERTQVAWNILQLRAARLYAVCDTGALSAEECARRLEELRSALLELDERLVVYMQADDGLEEASWALGATPTGIFSGRGGGQFTVEPLLPEAMEEATYLQAEALLSGRLAGKPAARGLLALLLAEHSGVYLRQHQEPMRALLDALGEMLPDNGAYQRNIRHSRSLAEAYFLVLEEQYSRHVLYGDSGALAQELKGWVEDALSRLPDDLLPELEQKLEEKGWEGVNASRLLTFEWPMFTHMPIPDMALLEPLGLQSYAQAHASAPTR